MGVRKQKVDLQKEKKQAIHEQLHARGCYQEDAYNIPDDDEEDDDDITIPEDIEMLEERMTYIKCSSNFFCDLLDSMIVDVASECHRIAKLGLDHSLDEEEEELRLSEQARERSVDGNSNGETNSKYVVDIFGQTHPAIASEIFDCMNCGRSIMAGRFAPHLEKCMGKGRKARAKTTRSSSSVPQNRTSRSGSVSIYARSNAATLSRTANGISSASSDEYVDFGFGES